MHAVLEGHLQADPVVGLRDGGRPVVVVVPDRHGDGTNALLVSPPDAIPFRFGAGSRAIHLAAGTEAGASVAEVGGELALDVDTPDDLLLAEAALSAAERPGARHRGEAIARG